MFAYFGHITKANLEGTRISRVFRRVNDINGIFMKIFVRSRARVKVNYLDNCAARIRLRASNCRDQTSFMSLKKVDVHEYQVLLSF